MTCLFTFCCAREVDHALLVACSNQCPEIVGTGLISHSDHEALGLGAGGALFGAGVPVHRLVRVTVGLTAG
eukprot:10093110-Prorocentrum_lima.AAC.1